MSINEKHFVVVVGARPNFIKAAPLFLRQKQYPHICLTLIHTGQHYDDNMSRIFFDEMGIPRPAIYLDVADNSPSVRTGQMISGLKKVFKHQTRCDGVIVFGDIDSTLAAAVAARAAGKKVLHVESGLRSHDRRMPEERNRILVDHLSSVLFTTEPVASENLVKEGIREDLIYHVGNVMIESLEAFGPLIHQSNVLEEIGLGKQQYIVATIHRAENTDDKNVLRKILEVLDVLAQSWTVVLPLHPGTRVKIDQYGFLPLLSNIRTVEPLGYFEFLKLVVESAGVVTDSGGIQEETTHLKIACATLRDNTERPITLEKGTNRLFPLATLKADEIIGHIEQVTAAEAIPLWDGEVSDRIFKVLESDLM